MSFLYVSNVPIDNTVRFSPVTKLEEAAKEGTWKIESKVWRKALSKNAVKLENLHFLFSKITIEKKDDIKKIEKWLQNIKTKNKSLKIEKITLSNKIDLKNQVSFLTAAAQSTSSVFRGVLIKLSSDKLNPNSPAIDDEVVKQLRFMVSKREVDRFASFLPESTVELGNLTSDQLKRTNILTSKNENQDLLAHLLKLNKNHPLVINSLALSSTDQDVRQLIGRKNITIKKLKVEFDWDFIKKHALESKIVIYKIFSNNIQKNFQEIEFTITKNDSKIDSKFLLEFLDMASQRRLTYKKTDLTGPQYEFLKYVIENAEITFDQVEDESIFSIIKKVPISGKQSQNYGSLPLQPNVEEDKVTSLLQTPSGYGGLTAFDEIGPIPPPPPSGYGSIDPKYGSMPADSNSKPLNPNKKAPPTPPQGPNGYKSVTDII